MLSTYPYNLSTYPYKGPFDAQASVLGDGTTGRTAAGLLDGSGTGYTAEFAAKNGRPCKAVLLSDEDAAAQIRD